MISDDEMSDMNLDVWLYFFEFSLKALGKIGNGLIHTEINQYKAIK